jgi:PAS domain S-box-containing protein
MGRLRSKTDIFVLCLEGEVRPGTGETMAEKDLFERLLESAPDAMVVVDRAGIIRIVNRRTEELFGYTREEMVGHPVEMFVPAQIVARHPAFRSAYFADPRPRPMGAGLELTASRKDGSQFPVDISLSPLETEDEVLVSAAVRDITERVLAEGARASLAAIVSSSDDAIIGKTLGGMITSWNPAAENLYGYSASEAIGKHISMLLWPEQHEIEEVILERVRNGGRVDSYETTRAHKEGRSVDVSISISPIQDSRNQLIGTASIHRDIGEKKLSQAKLRTLQSQRLESLGQLAGGVAHDFNNLLAAILNYAELIAESPGDEESVRQDIAEIKRAAERAAVLTHQLLIFGRREIVNPEVLDLNAVVADLEKLLRRTLGEHIDLRTRPAQGLWPMKADPSGVEQVLMNLVVNARDAIGDRGVIAIDTANVESHEELEATGSLAPGRYVRLSVSDDGGGMAEDVVARAFEPFFTTKPRGQGSGLGLATVYGIAKQSGGDVRIYSNPELGTVVRVYFPATAEVSAKPNGKPEVEALDGRGESVLVVEDEDQVREPTVRVLAKRGYEVLSARNGLDALGIVRARTEPIHLLLTDVVMPQMSGQELAQEVTRLRPGTRVLFMSGYPQDVFERGIGAPKWPLLEKPFTIPGLLQRVRQVLDEQPTHEGDV